MNIQAALQALERMLEGFIASLPNIILAALVFLLTYVGSRLVRRTVKRIVERAQVPPPASLILSRLSQWLSLLLGSLIALLILFPSFNAGQLIELLGIGSLAIGFAFRDIVQNFLAGILILLTQPFRIGDQIVVEGFEGTVEDIQTRATFIKTYDGRRVVIPNSELFTRSVIVNTAHPTRRSEREIGIGYGDDIERARQVILDSIAGLEAILPQPAPDARVVGLADSAVLLRVRWWSNSRRADIVELEDRVLTRIKVALTEAGIDMPFPTQQILFHDQTEASDGDRARQREGWPADPSGNPSPSRLSGTLSALAEAIGPA